LWRCASLVHHDLAGGHAHRALCDDDIALERDRARGIVGCGLVRADDDELLAVALLGRRVDAGQGQGKGEGGGEERAHRF